MEENQKSIDGVIEKLAMIADGLETLFSDGKIAVALELKKEDFKKVQGNFREIDRQHNQFMIEMSNVQFMFLLGESLNDESNNS